MVGNCLALAQRFRAGSCLFLGLQKDGLNRWAGCLVWLLGVADLHGSGSLVR